MYLTFSYILSLALLVSSFSADGIDPNSSKVLPQELGKKMTPEQRIVGGYEVDPPFMYPFLVSIQKSRKHFCAGTLYNKNTVITAGHCTHQDIIKEIDVVAHRHNLALSDNQEHGTRYKVDKFIIHPNFDLEEVENDIAVWKLKPKYNPNLSQKAIVLDDGRVSKNSHKLGQIAGWGATAFNGKTSKKLLEVKIPFADMRRCLKKYNSLGVGLDKERQLCAGYPEGGKDACQDDSGGPLFVRQGRDFVLVGLVSWGIECAKPGFPGIYTRIEYYRNWIEENSY